MSTQLPDSPDPNKNDVTLWKKLKAYVLELKQSHEVLVFIGLYLTGLFGAAKSGLAFFETLRPGIIPTTDPLWWVMIVGLIGMVSSLTWGMWLAIRLFPRFRRSVDYNKGFLFRCYETIVESYESKGSQGFADLHSIIAGLRTIYINFVITLSLLVIANSYHEETAASFVVRQLCALQIFLSLLFLFFMATRFFGQLSFLSKLKISTTSLDVIDEKATSVFWSAAKWDFVYVTAISASSFSILIPFHLGYILPLTGAWLFTKKQANTAFQIVIAGIVLKFLGGWGLSYLSVELDSKFPEDHFDIPVLFWSMVSELIFWGTFCMLLAIIRHLRSTAKEKAKSLHLSLESEYLLRRALEQHSVLQNQGLFVKNSDRRFIFANEVLLNYLTPVLKKNGFPMAGPTVLWKEIEMKTDADLGINCPEYEKSDNHVLMSKSAVTDVWEGYEPFFDPLSSIGPQVWTQKAAIRDEQSKIVGLVGSIVPGFPRELQEMVNYITDRMPVYASMKDVNGHVVWANDLHLEKLKGRIEEILREQGKEEYTKFSLPVQLKAINNGKGPLDADLYNETPAKRYRDRDILVLERATRCAGDSAAFDAEMKQLVKEWFPNITDYPQHGWFEHHFFPGEKNGRWVEVRKMPWWQFVLDDQGKTQRTLKGILVFFSDAHKGHLRKSVVWRWVDIHLGRAIETHKRLISDPMTKKRSDLPIEWLQKYEMPSLIRKMLLFFKSFVDGQPSEMEPEQVERSVHELQYFVKFIEEVFNGIISIKLSIEIERFNLKRNGDEYFAIIIPLILNTVEAAVRNNTEFKQCSVEINLSKGEYGDKDPSDVSEQYLLITIKSKQGKVLSGDRIKQIERFEMLNDSDQMPGGGYFLARQLASYLLKRDGLNLSDDRYKDTIRIEGRGSQVGSKTSITLPIRLFESD